MLYYCFSGFYVSNLAVQSIACHTLKTCYFSLSEQINSNLGNIINKIVEMIYEQNFFEGLIFIPNILYDVVDIDSHFDVLFSVCCFSLNSNNIEISSYSWLILSIISRRSKFKIREYFERIYCLSYEFLQKDFQTHSSNALQCLCSLTRSCSDLFKSKLDEITPILIKWYLSDDTSLQQDSITGFITFIKFHRQYMERFIGILIPRIIKNCTSDYPEELIKEIHKNESNSVFNFVTRVVDSDLRLLSVIIRHFPQYFHSNDIVLSVFSCLFKSYQCILNSILISSNFLFRSLLRLNISNASHIFSNMLLTNLSFLENSRDVSLIISCIKTFNTSFRIFGQCIFNCKEKNFFELCFALLDQLRNDTTEECSLIEFHHRICTLMCHIIQSSEFKPEILQQFIPNLLELDHSKYESERVICINVFTHVIHLVPECIIRQLFQISVHSIAQYESKYAQNYVFFLFKLSKYSPNFFQGSTRELIFLIIKLVNEISNPNTADSIFREYLLGLFASIDEIEPFANEEIVKWFSSFLPLTSALEFAPSVYSFVVRHFPRFKAQLSRSVLEPFSTRNVALLNRLIDTPELLLEMHKCACFLSSEMKTTGNPSGFGSDFAAGYVLQSTLNEISDILSQGLTQKIQM